MVKEGREGKGREGRKDTDDEQVRVSIDRCKLGFRSIDRCAGESTRNREGRGAGEGREEGVLGFSGD
jgi:hypothetical protein